MTNKHDERVERAVGDLDDLVESYAESTTVRQRIERKEGYQNRLRQTLTTHTKEVREQTLAEVREDSATHSLLQEIMDDVSMLHQRKELDDNGFCTMRDLLHSKAINNLLDDNK